MKQKETWLIIFRLYDLHWSISISRKAVEFMNSCKWNKPSLIPLADDVLKLNTYLKEEGKNAFERLTRSDATESDYRNLGGITLTHLIVFNRKRVGEVERITKKTYLEKLHNEDNQKEIESSLSECEKLLVKTMSLVYIRGKKGRKVPLLMTPTMLKYIYTLLLRRDCFGVPSNNNYVFGNPICDSFLRGADTLRAMATKCGASKPENLTSTRLRKHIATFSRILNLSEKDMEQITQHMGHSESVHRQFYRLPDSTLELAKMTKLLLTFEKGNLTPGQKLDDMVPDIDSANESSDEETLDTSTNDLDETDDPEVQGFEIPETSVENEIQKPHITRKSRKVTGKSAKKNSSDIDDDYEDQEEDEEDEDDYKKVAKRKPSNRNTC
ncbi:uncharacterized protein LOC120352517 [Nilaparvata lugens]|uniref:uncharacterized protein LOC120352517 n=1 Tax=Nilaparvata lugens TaxID=108931 RepID=UPI00193E473D|nr:uncharacterized protein LOC120352517 [Nilaparvata lugens]